MNTNTLTETLSFFAMTSAELIALFFVVSFMVAMMQEYVPASTVQRLLTGRGLGGNIVGAGLGAVTPFCSCSTIPVTVGLLNAGAPFGATMSFLVSSPIPVSYTHLDVYKRQALGIEKCGLIARCA